MVLRTVGWSSFLVIFAQLRTPVASWRTCGSPWKRGMKLLLNRQRRQTPVPLCVSQVEVVLIE